MLAAGLGALVLLLYIGGFIFVLVTLVYIIVKRIKEKKKEDFEKRDS